MPSIPTDDDLEYAEQDNPTLFDIVRKNPNMTYNEATKAQEDIRLDRDAKKGKGFEKEIDYHRYWKNMYEKEYKLRQEAQGETTIVKGIGMNSPEMKDAKARIKELEETLRSRDYTKAQDYKFLVEENKKLHKEVDDLKRNEEKRISRTREAGF